MTTDQAESADLRRLNANCDWFGYLTLENLEAVATRLRAMFGPGQPYTFVTVNELFNYRPETRTDQVASKIETWTEEGDSPGFGGITINDTYGVWGLHAAASNQASARKLPGTTNQAFLEFSRNQIKVTHRTPAGDRLYWTAAVQDSDRCSCDGDPIECAHETARHEAEQGRKRDLVAFAADVRQLIREYSDPERGVISQMAFEATFDQITIEKYGIEQLDGGDSSDVR